MDSLEQWILDIGRHVGALEAENEVLNETIERLRNEIGRLESHVTHMTTSRDGYKTLYEEQLRKPVPHDPLVQAAEDACGCTKPRIMKDIRYGRSGGDQPSNKTFDSGD